MTADKCRSEKLPFAYGSQSWQAKHIDVQQFLFLNQGVRNYSAPAKNQNSHSKQAPTSHFFPHVIADYRDRASTILSIYCGHKNRKTDSWKFGWIRVFAETEMTGHAVSYTSIIKSCLHINRVMRNKLCRSHN